DNYSGPCWDCILCRVRDNEQFNCQCDDVYFKGIKIVKCFGSDADKIKLKSEVVERNFGHTTLVNLTYDKLGFRMSQMLTLEEDSCSDRTSVRYLYYGDYGVEAPFSKQLSISYFLYEYMEHRRIENMI
ncbi:unnamed protein product, partial [marine sediment metagenome]